MTAGWHMMLSFEPSLVGCFVWDQNHSFMVSGRSVSYRRRFKRVNL